jgi:glucose/arabinose dehydrogenase
MTTTSVLRAIGFVAASGISFGASAIAQQSAATSRFPLPAEPRIIETAQQRIVATVVARGIPHPFSLLVLPDGEMLVSERSSGKLHAIRKGALDPKPLAGVPTVHVGFHAGLLDLAAHPKFSENRLIYFTYHQPIDGTQYAIALARGRFEGSALTSVQDLYVGNPTRRSGGSRLAFAPDGTIYITTGGATGGKEPQDVSDAYGKVLRLRDDGGVPPDNPFVGRDGHRPEIFSLGHRDQYGLATHPTTGAVFQAELGPIGGDKINVILPGRNYGWPLYSYGRQNDSAPIDHPNRDGIEPAVITWQPGITPSGLIFYTGDKFPFWKGNLLVGSIQRGRIPGTGGVERVVFNDKLWELRRETFLTELKQRVRDIRQGPDGFIYVLTDEDDGAVIRVEPAK